MTDHLLQCTHCGPESAEAKVQELRTKIQNQEAMIQRLEQKAVDEYWRGYREAPTLAVVG